MLFIYGRSDLDFVIELAYAKINLYLDVVEKKQNGYHNILSLMQTVDLCDEVRISRRKTNRKEIDIFCLNDDNLNNRENLAYKAAETFLVNSPNISDCISIELTKNIPVSAGLAGGSADAAAVLRGLNKLFDHPFSKEELCKMGATLGADVPFCILGGAFITEGIGDELTLTEGLSDCLLVVACGSVGISTPAAYKALDSKFCNFNNYSSGIGFEKMITSLSEGDVVEASKHRFNIFESINQDNESVNEIKNILKKNGSEFYMMSGSGPSVYGIFSNSDDALRACEEIKSKSMFATICRPVRI